MYIVSDKVFNEIWSHKSLPSIKTSPVLTLLVFGGTHNLT